MKILIIFDSLFGNTGKIARALKDGIRIKNVVLKNVNEINPDEIKGADLLFVGSPTHGGMPSKPMQNFLNTIPDGLLKGVYAAAFDTGIPAEGQSIFMKIIINIFKYASPRIAKQLKDKGADIVGTETFFVTGKEGPLKEGEPDRAKKCASKIFTSI